jgi:hypothetical protein
MKKQLMTGAIAAGAMAIGCLGQMGSAEAATLVQNGGKVQGITGLDISGLLYDVKFAPANYNGTFNGKPDPTFLGNETGATNAVNAIVSFFNAQNVESGAFPSSPDTFYVPFAVAGDKAQDLVSVIVGSYSNPNWIRSGPLSNGDTERRDQLNYAVFTASSTAIPTPALLPGLIGMGITALRKKKQSATQEA